MPPKNKKEPKAKKLPPVDLDNVDTTDMTIKKLQTYTVQIYEEIIKEKDQAKFFQIEKDKLRAFWEVSRQQLKDIRWQIRSKDKEIDEAQEKSRKDIKLSQQKLKHVLHENYEHITEAKYFTFLQLMEKRDNFENQINEIHKDINDIKLKIKEEDYQHKSQIRLLETEYATDVSKVRDENTIQLEEMEAKFDKQFNNAIQKLQAKQLAELGELETRKENQISDLIMNNKKFIEQIKHYYNNLIEHNLSVIERMKESNDAMKNKLAATEKQLREAKSENINLRMPLDKGREDIKILQKKLEFYDRDQEELKKCTKTLNKLTTHLDNLQWEHEAVSLIVQRQQQERKESHHRLFVRSLEIQMESSNQSVLLERIIKRVLSAIECIYSTIEKHGDLVGKEILIDLEKFGFRKDVKKDIEYEICVVAKAFHDVLKIYKNKMQEHSIHIDELGFIELSFDEILKIR